MVAPIPAGGSCKTSGYAFFDAYGTLFDVAAAARDLATEPGREGFAEVWPQVAADWRLKQLQYSMAQGPSPADHCDFWQVTQDGLDWALARVGQQGRGPARGASGPLLAASGLSGGAGDACPSQGGGAVHRDLVER